MVAPTQATLTRPLASPEDIRDDMRNALEGLMPSLRRTAPPPSNRYKIHPLSQEERGRINDTIQQQMHKSHTN